MQSAAQSFPGHGGRATAATETSVGMGKQRPGRICWLFLFPAAVAEKENWMVGKPVVISTALPLLLLTENSHTQVLVLTRWECVLYTPDKRIYHEGTLQCEQLE